MLFGSTTQCVDAAGRQRTNRSGRLFYQRTTLSPREESRMPRQHDYEPQPEAPDLGASVQLETAESLVAPPGADGLDAGYVPPDLPYLLDEQRITAAELSEPETLDERLARERPD